MKFTVQSFILWILISATNAKNAPIEDNTPRVRRSGTTVCVEVRPTRSHQEPYYMCKDGEVPSEQPTATFRPFASAKSLPIIKPRANNEFEAERDVSTAATFAAYRGQSQLGQQPIYALRPPKFHDFNLQSTNEQSSLAFADQNPHVWAFPRFPQQTTQTQPILQPALQSESTARALELYAQNAPYFATAEKPFQTLQTQYRYQPKQSNEYKIFGQGEAPNSFIPRQRHEYSEPNQRSSIPYTANYRSRFFGEPSQSSSVRYNAAPELNSPDTNAQFPYVFPATLDQLVTMDRPTYEPFTGVARSTPFQAEYDTNRPISDQDLSFGDVDFTKTTPFLATSQPPANLIVDMTPEELRKILIQPTVPTEFMSDPVLRNFYSSLEDQNGLARSLQALLKETESEFNENTAPTTPIQTPETKPICPTCERTTDDDIDNFNVERVAAREPCANKEFNWPPVVIAMPCCGQQSSTPPAPQMPAAGFYNPYSMPMLGMYPSLMTPYNAAALANTNYAQAFQHQNYQNMQQMSGANSQSRSANTEIQTYETTTAKTIPVTVSITEKSTKAPEEVTESVTTESEDETMKTELPHSAAETITTTESTLDASVTDATEVTDALKLKDDLPKTFQTMLNRAKTFKELAEAEMKDDTLNHDAKKGKRQNFKDANAALRTIAEVVAASNKRKYSTVIH